MVGEKGMRAAFPVTHTHTHTHPRPQGSTIESYGCMEDNLKISTLGHAFNFGVQHWTAFLGLSV